MPAGNRDLMTGQVEVDETTPSKNFPRRKKYSLGPVKCFGVELTPDNIAVAMVYFVQGVLGLSRLAVGFYLKDDLHLDPAEVCHLQGLCGLCFCSKETYCSFLVDRFHNIESYRTCYPVVVLLVFTYL